MPNKSKKSEQSKPVLPPQHQDIQPGREAEMTPAPKFENDEIRGSAKLSGRVALITGGDSGIGRAIALAFAREEADIVIVYKNEDPDAKQTEKMIHEKGRSCITIRCDVSDETQCSDAVNTAITRYGRLDILVNNAAEQHPRECITQITKEQLWSTFGTNIFSMFYLSAAALPHLKQSKGSTIINTTSVTAYRGSGGLLDYSSTKGAIVSFTRSLASQLAKDNIRVNAVAPGPIWTPLIPSTFPAEEVAEFGSDSPLGRPGQPWECAESYVFLASLDSTFMTGQVLHPNGGEIING